MTYLILKLAHLLGAALLLGTGLGIAFFTWFGVRESMRSGRIELLRGVLRGTVIADAAFTATAAVLQPITGAALYAMLGLPWSSAWLWTVLGLYVFVGVCWLPVVALQIRMRNAAMRAPTVDALPPRFQADYRRWRWLGVPGFGGVLVLYVLMVFRLSWWSA